jgi:hypothetical protein
MDVAPDFHLVGAGRQLRRRDQDHLARLDPRVGLRPRLGAVLRQEEDALLGVVRVEREVDARRPRRGDGPPAIYLLERAGAAESIRGAYKTWGSK